MIIRQKGFQSKGHFIMINGPTHQEDTIILNVYKPNNKAAKYTKQQLIELMEEID